MAFDDNAQLLSLDLLLYLVALSIVLMLSVYIYMSFDSSSSDMIGQSINDERLEKLEWALFRTPGNPVNWDEDTRHVDSVGLCVDNDSYLISYDKLIRLKDNPNLIYTIFPSEFKCNIKLVPDENPSQRINLINTYSYSSYDNVLTHRVPIIIDYGYDIFPIDSNKDDYNCPYNHLNDSTHWMCKSFNITSNAMDDTSYYIVTNDADIILSNTYAENQSFHVNDNMDITDKLIQLIHDNEDTIYIHVHSSDDEAYLIADRNNRPQHINTIRNPEKYTAIIEIST